MDFDLSEEQRLLKDSVDGLLNDSYDFESRKKYGAEKGGWSKSVWNKLAEQGLLGLPFSEDDGGFGAGAVETMIVMEALRQGAAARAVSGDRGARRRFYPARRLGGQKAAHIPGIIDGSKTLAFAQLEKNSRYDLHDVATSAKKKGDGWVIDGEKFRRAQRRERRHAGGDRAHQGRPARHHRHRRVSRSRQCQGRLEKGYRPRRLHAADITSPASRSD